MRATPRVILILKQASSAVRLHKTRAQKLAMTDINRKLAKIRVFKRGFFHFFVFFLFVRFLCDRDEKGKEWAWVMVSLLSFSDVTLPTQHVAKVDVQ